MIMLGIPRQLVCLGVLLLSLMALQLIYAKESTCDSKTSCTDCIQVPECKWCSKLKTNGSSEGKCFASSKNLTDICFESSEYVENPEPNETIIKDDPISASTDNRPPIQLKPQEVELALRKGMVYSLKVQYVQAKDYPVDLYYIMDLSKSMEDDKENVANLGKKIATELKRFTDQVRLGFGSFIDKVSLPFVDMQPSKLENPCTTNDRCGTPYSFKNQLSLTDKLDSFKDGVDNAIISGNIDSPEGGFDGLMQVMKCKEVIGWDDNVRKIVVFSTDASFHYAGDGKLAGVVIPNDENCHLDNVTGDYTHALEYDYPSVSQINKVAKEENINIIFAITERKYRELYTDLSSEIESSSFGILEKGSSGIVDLVVNQYKAITSKIEIKDNSADLGGQLALEVWIKCPGEAYKKERICDKIKEGSKVDLRLEITLLSCSAAEDSDPIVLEVGTSQDKIKINVKTLCECDCASPGHSLYNVSSDVCNGGGSLICGACKCDPGYFGNTCQCEIGKGPASSEEDQKKCLKDGEEKECSGNGHCSCGQCECKKGYTGSYCECNTRQCLSERSESEEEVCSGYGTCDCETCKCTPGSGRQGDTCECPDDSACKASDSSEVCSGEGKCECGVCKCFDGGNFFGQFCEECPTCKGGQCDNYRDCAQYKGFETGRFSQQDFDKNCSSLEIKKEDDLTPELNLGATRCQFTDEEDDCLFTFTYRYIPTDKTYTILVQRLKDCPEPPNILAITIGVIAAIVAVGLLTLLIWKLLTTLHDKREYAKFEEDMKKTKWQTDENPIYHAATTTIINPAFSHK